MMPKKGLLRVIVFVVVIVASKADNYDYDTSLDPCSSFYETEEAGECHHNQLPNKTFQIIYGPQAVSCCSEQSYRFYDHCEVSLLLFNYLVSQGYNGPGKNKICALPSPHPRNEGFYQRLLKIVYISKISKFLDTQLNTANKTFLTVVSSF